MTSLVLQPPEFVQQQVEMPVLPPTADTPGRQAFDLAFQREATNFTKMLPALLPTYENQVVAIYQGQVIAYGDDILEVYNTVVDKYGEIPCYVQRVNAKPLRKVRIPTAWKQQ